MIKVIKTHINDLLIIEPQIFEDSRGYFLESYNVNEFAKHGIHYNFVQDNRSKSTKGVLRGLHFQKQFPQAKLVSVIEGEVFDVAVDLRKNSPTYGKSFGILLSGENKKMLMIPRGFAHGFLVTSETAVFSYKCDEFYHPEDEGGIIWNDPDVNVQWPFTNDIILSDKDKLHKTLKELKFEFKEDTL